MKHRDFGRMDGPVVLFGGPYSNFQAMEALAAILDGRNAICSGDIVAYCAEPNETTRLFLDLGLPGIAGNCEMQLLAGAKDCGCGFESGSTCDLLSSGWWPFLAREMDGELVWSLGELPEIGSFVHEEKRYAVIHGGATSANRFLWPSSPDWAFAEEISLLEDAIGAIDGVVAGHSGIAFQRNVNGYHWINAGAIGLPPNDGRCETRYAVLDGGEVAFHRLRYDHRTAIERMRAAGLSQGYEKTLGSGLWPSEDVLPVELRR